MKEKIVLPKLNLPRQTTHWAVKVIWAASAMLVAQVVLFGVVVWKQQATQAAAVAVLEAEKARLAAAPAPVEAVAPAKAQRGSDTTLAAMAPASGHEAQAAAEPAPAAKAERSARKPSTKRRASTRVLAKASPSKAAKPVKDDGLDDLLKRFR